ncbi:MAG TPA: prepilin-type N-terminal cleavage/methylation domain-containing protein [Phycisphaerae bacterium]|nr:prepilin-type N-terminal cleavage/methylation domain-containing protein [Phycisphaerae bacterium]
MVVAKSQAERRNPPAVRRRALTLLEVLLAIALMVLLMAGVFVFYLTALRAREEGKTYTQDVKLYRSVLAGIAQEIRHATMLVPGDGIGFKGDRDKITVVRMGLPENYVFDEYDPMLDQLPPAQQDLRRITYELLWDDDKKDDEGVRICYGLWRTEQKTFDPNPRFVNKEAETTGLEEQENPEIMGPQPEGELYAPEIKFLEFAYFDGAQWRDRWQFAEGGEGGGQSRQAAGPMSSGPTLPQAVRITIGRVRFDPDGEMFDLSKWQDMEEHPEQKEYHPDRFTVVVPILEADPTLMSSRQSGVADSMARQERGANP